MRMLGLLLVNLFGFIHGDYLGAGMQLFRDETILLVQGLRSGKWGFPKGHRELRDLSWRDTAVREVYEETGYTEFTDYILCTEIPRVFGNRPYWSGIVTSTKEPRVNRSEHRAVEWFPLDSLDTLRLTRAVNEWYTLDRQVCKKLT